MTLSRSTSDSAAGEFAERRKASSSSRSRRLCRGIGGLTEAHRLVPGEPVALLPTGVGERALEIACQAVDLPPEVEVLEERIGQAAELAALLGRHRVPHRLGGRHPSRQLLEQLVEALRVAGEHVAEALHEGLERRIERFTGLALLEHAVERVEGLAHLLQLSGIGVGECVGHLVEVGTGDLFAQTIEELFEVLARLGGHELVLLEAAHHAREVARKEVELHPSFVRHLTGHLFAPLVT